MNPEETALLIIIAGCALLLAVPAAWMQTVLAALNG